MSNSADDALPTEVRLDELAREAGIPTTTVRLYQNKGLLPGPRLAGRTGWYGPHHLARLRLITRLQDEGFSLAGIARLLDTWESGQDLADLVGIETQLDALLSRRRSVILDPADLLARFPDGTLTPELIGQAVELGVVEMLDDGRLRIPDQRFLEIGGALGELGVPTGVILDEWSHLVGLTDEVATRFIGLFEAHLLPAGTSPEDLDPDAVARLASDLGRLHRLAGQVLLAALDDSIARLGAQRLGMFVTDVGSAEPT
jgi:DNA-binding transcriptional MerR regulator